MSNAAAPARSNRAADYLSILTWLQPLNVKGGTHAEWCRAFGRESSTSGRFTELAAAELIAGVPGETRRSPAHRAGQVYRLSVRGAYALRAGREAVLNAVRAGKSRRSSSRG